MLLFGGGDEVVPVCLNFLADLFLSRILIVSVKEFNSRYVKVPFPRAGLCKTKAFQSSWQTPLEHEDCHKVHRSPCTECTEAQRHKEGKRGDS